MGLFCLLSIGECFFVQLPMRGSPHAFEGQELPKKKSLSRAAVLTLLKPYIWPNETEESAAINRIRAILTWVSVILSKVCNLVSPILVSAP